MKRQLLILAVSLFASYSAFSQTNFALNYTVGIPTGETKDFIGKTSFRGVSLDFSYFMDYQFEIGFSTGWQIFYEDYGYQTEVQGTQTLTSTRKNYINSIPLYATGTYFFTKKQDLRPYFTLGAGTIYNQIDENIGFYTFSNSGWQFGLRPELGIRKKVNYGFGVTASARYNYGFETKDIPELSYYTVALGLIWMH